MGKIFVVQGQVTPKRIVNSSEIIMHVLVTCKFKEDAIKSEGVRAVTAFFPL